MNLKKLLSLLTAGAMSLSVVAVSAMSTQGDTMMQKDTMMKSDSMMQNDMMKSDDAMMMKKSMTRQEKRAMAKEKMMKRREGRMMKKGDGMMKSDDSMMKKNKGTMMKGGDAMMKKDGAMEKTDMMMKAGEYKDSIASILSDSVLSDGKTKVLFFHASWCPACKAANTTLTSWYNSGDGLLTTYKINYDTEKALKQKYGVTYQHTFVKIDGQGKIIKLLQSPSDEDLKNFLKS